MVKNSDGSVMPGAHVSARGIDYTGTSTAQAGADGRFCMAVRKNSRVAVLAEHAAGGGQEREVQSGDATPPSSNT